MFYMKTSIMILADVFENFEKKLWMIMDFCDESVLQC